MLEGGGRTGGDFQTLKNRPLTSGGVKSPRRPDRVGVNAPGVCVPGLGPREDEEKADSSLRSE